MGEKNEVYYYGGSAKAGAFGLDFGTNPVMGMANNHATLNPITGGGFNDDSTNDLGINSSTDQWVHIAMVWNGTNVITYVNGLPKITTAGSGVTALATAQSLVIIGCNPTNNSCFNGLFDELRIWNVARTATQIHGQLQQADGRQRHRPGRLLEVRRGVRNHRPPTPSPRRVTPRTTAR